MKSECKYKRLNKVEMGRVNVVVPNFNRRLSGVTSTIVQLVPLQKKWIGVATLGIGLPDTLPRMRWRQIPSLLRRPSNGQPRVWHARRNIEMLSGVILRDVFRAPLKILFTSASQREHTGWTRFLINRMDGVVATSHKTAAYLRVPNTVIMHGIDTERFHPPVDRAAVVRELGLDPQQSYVGCFGRVRHQKGTDLFVDAMISLLPANPKWSAIVAGRVTQKHKLFEDNLKRRVAKAGLSDRILFVGERRDIERWYQALSLYVAPQRWEGFGLTPLESMASGVPVVAADVGVFSELIRDGENGVIVPPNDPDSLRAGIEPYLTDVPLTLLCGQAGREHVLARFQLRFEAERLISIYRRLSQKAMDG